MYNDLLSMKSHIAWGRLSFQDFMLPLVECGLYCNHLVHPSVHTSIIDFSASTGRNDLIFGMWLFHGDLYRFSPFQVYHTSTSCLTHAWLRIFHGCVMKMFVTDIPAFTGRNYFIFGIWLWLSDLYRFFPFLAYHTSTSCSKHAWLRIFHVCIRRILVIDILASTGRNDFTFGIWLRHSDLYWFPPFQVYCTSTSCWKCAWLSIFSSPDSSVCRLLTF